jgi:hypothetical protein
LRVLPRWRCWHWRQPRWRETLLLPR